ncbi:hypothetical protein PAMP_003620 [Pampus punctatissimus]
MLPLKEREKNGERWKACFKVDRGPKSAKDTDDHVNSTQQVLWTVSPEDEEGEDDGYTSGDAVAARNAC